MVTSLPGSGTIIYPQFLTLATGVDRVGNVFPQRPRTLTKSKLRYADENFDGSSVARSIQLRVPALR